MNIQVDTLEFATTLEQAGMARPHAEAIAKLQAKAITDLVTHDLVTKDDLRVELALTKTELREEITQTKTVLREEITQTKAELREEIRKSAFELRQDFRQDLDMIRLELRSLKYAAGIAAFAVSAVVVLARLIR